MTPAPRRARLAADRFSADQLVLQVSQSFDPAVFDLDAYDDFITAIARGRDYQREAIETAVRFFCGGQYADTAELGRKSWEASPDLKRRWATADALIKQLPFPDMLDCTLDLATGTGKSFAIYAVARTMLNEGVVDRVLVLCPSLTIEAALKDKFTTLTADSELAATLPERPGGHPIPDVVDAGSTVKESQICVENIHATDERTSSSLADSFASQGDRTLVISDEVHHVYSPTGERWRQFVGDPAYGFRFHLGASGTCYAGNDYLTDVVYRYSIRDAINDGWVKEVYYLAEDDSATDSERFQKLLAQHEKNRVRYGRKPLTIAVTKDIKAAEALTEELTAFLATQKDMTAAAAENEVLVVTSADRHKGNVLKLQTVDDNSDAVEWIVSVSMLTEGWDVKNVFQIYPHEQRAFNSKLLIAQVLGRGLRIPEGFKGQPAVHVFNHQRWAPQIDDYVAEVLDEETTIGQRPVTDRAVEHFAIHHLDYKNVPVAQHEAKDIEAPRQITRLAKLRPQLDAPEETKFVSATDATKGDVLTTRVIEKRYQVEDVVEEVRQRLLDHDKRTGGTLAPEYPKPRVRELIVEGLQALKLAGEEVSQENRQLILSAFGSLRQKRTRAGARLETKPKGFLSVRTEEMRAIHGRISALTSTLGLFYDEESEALGTEADAAALKKALDIDEATNIVEVPNSFNFKSPTNVVLASHNPERRFVQRLMHHKNAPAIKAWIKASDVSFYAIEFTWQRGGTGRSKRGQFNPDFFIQLKDADCVAVVEVKADNDDSDQNRGKVAAAHTHFQLINEMLVEAAETRRYTFHLVSPVDYDRFFEALRESKLEAFRSGLQAALQGATEVGAA